MIEARLWKPLEDGRVHCRVCSHFCVIESGNRGLCGVRLNRDGTLYTLVYDRVASLGLDPVEKKPLYHYKPGTSTLSFATQGCNFSCTFCQNASLSQPPREGADPMGDPVTPEALVQAAKREGAQSISYTYSEPTIFFELMQDTARLAHQEGLGNIMVSNGFQSPECLKELDGLIDAANIDLKAFSENFYRDIVGAKLKPVLRNLKTIKKMGWWLEVTTLLIPGKNDDPDELRELAKFIANELGTDTPWHLSRFHPQHRMRDVAMTSVSSLETAVRFGREAGLEYIYIGNVPGHDYTKTHCPACGELVLDRAGFGLSFSALANGCCAACGRKISGVDLG
ncbi:AmmeMemoRadiSam system radical SAM enzyme [Salidesulfovibrio brasiliensis]|uniref:AmmeMemoRadiSam system radical SAM enzyme n=1 Tax=Salidesulfovibrio brasiliensis TaxID=221711 RepID=UPI0006D0118E|nr:AmmeMemoRadiSam system radical SAM enzyme [Salidesulfovibrio brasiliensis]